MKLFPENIYHIYNRGNNKNTIFFNRVNYLFFLKKMRNYLKPYIEILSYCLMPNHFHFLVYSLSEFDSVQFGKNFKILLSSYSKAVNIQQQRTGSLFQQNTKAKCLTEGFGKYEFLPLICFNYIHKNPLSAGLANKMEDWEFSSFRDYIGVRNGTLCNHEFSCNLLNLPSNEKDIYELSY